MLTDLPTLRAELKAKRGYRRSLVQELRDAKTPKTAKSIAAAEKRIREHENMIERLRTKIAELQSRQDYLRENRDKQRQRIRQVDAEIVGLRFLIGVVASAPDKGKRNSTKSVERREVMDSPQATLKWLTRLGRAILRGDNAEADRMVLELAVLTTDKQQK